MKANKELQKNDKLLEELDISQEEYDKLLEELKDLMNWLHIVLQIVLYMMN